MTDDKRFCRGIPTIYTYATYCVTTESKILIFNGLINLVCIHLFGLATVGTLD